MRSCKLNCSEDVLTLCGASLSHLDSISVDCESRASVETTLAIHAIKSASTTIRRVQLLFEPEHVLRELHDIVTFQSLVVLSVFASHSLLDTDLIAMLQKTPHVTHLDLSLCWQLTDQSGVFVARHVSQLKTLNIAWCYFSNATVHALGTYRADTLHTLNISNCGTIDDTGLHVMLARCKKLCVLHTYAYVVPWTSSHSVPLLQNLTALILEVGVSIVHHLQNIPFICGKLQYISIDSLIACIDFSAYSILNLPYLRTIHIGRSKDMNPTLDALQLCRPTLRVLRDDSKLNFFDVMKLPL